MEHVKDLSTENARMHDLLDRYFASRRTLKSSAAETSFHLDEDSLATFVEGTLSLRESGRVVDHLVNCRFCLHKTAELVRLDLELAEVSPAALVDTAQPVSISTVLSDLFSKIFGTNDSAVFAHEEKKDDESNPSDKSESDEDKKI